VQTSEVAHPPSRGAAVGDANALSALARRCGDPYSGRHMLVARAAAIVVLIGGLVAVVVIATPHRSPELPAGMSR